MDLNGRARTDTENFVSDSDLRENEVKRASNKVDIKYQWETGLSVIPRECKQFWFWEGDNRSEWSVGYKMLNAIFNSVSL